MLPRPDQEIPKALLASGSHTACLFLCPVSSQLRAPIPTLGQSSALLLLVLCSLASDSASACLCPRTLTCAHTCISPPPSLDHYGAGLDALRDVDEVTSGYKHPQHRDGKHTWGSGSGL